jgi:hypothetical protein
MQVAGHKRPRHKKLYTTMGNAESNTRYKPVTWAHVEEKELPGLVKMATGKMQNWRRAMEDAELVDHDQEHKTLILGIFDGHVTPGTARYAAMRLPEIIKAHASYKTRDFGRALYDAFVAFDLECRNDEDAKAKLRVLGSAFDVYDVVHNMGDYDKIRAKGEHEGRVLEAIQKAVREGDLDPVSTIFEGE